MPKHRSTQIFIMLLLIAMVRDAHATEVKYKSASLRDPFSDPTDEKPIDNTSRVESVIKTLKVQGIIISGESKSAIINGKIYQVGSNIGQAVIKDIDRDGVVVLYNGKEYKHQYLKRGAGNENKVG